MKTFVYSAKDSTGRIISSQVEADNPKAVIEALRQEGFFVTRIVEKRRPFNPFVIFEKMVKIGLKELTIFSRQFALLLMTSAVELSGCLLSAWALNLAKQTLKTFPSLLQTSFAGCLQCIV